jgi:hypothetical protein
MKYLVVYQVEANNPREAVDNVDFATPIVTEVPNPYSSTTASFHFASERDSDLTLVERGDKQFQQAHCIVNAEQYNAPFVKSAQ